MPSFFWLEKSLISVNFSIVFFAQVTFAEKSQSFQGHCIKSGIVIFTWRFTWNYAYSPFNSPGSCISSGIRKLIQPRNELARKYRFNSFNKFLTAVWFVRCLFSIIVRMSPSFCCESTIKKCSLQSFIQSFKNSRAKKK